jgi:hypothetical protein
MKNLGTSIAALSRRAAGPALVLAALLLSAQAAAAEENHSGWSINFTPVLILPSGDDRFGGGVDPELKYTLDLGEARLSAGGRIGAYYARNLFGVTLMPTVRLMVPIGRVEPYAAIGFGYGRLPDTGLDGFATMGRLGFLYRFSERLAIGLEATIQQIDGSRYRFPSFGSMMSFNL